MSSNLPHPVQLGSGTLPATLVFLALSSFAFAEDPRLEPPKDLNGYFPFEVSKSPEAWEKRAEALKLQMRVALGIYPEPERTPLNAVVHGEMDRGDYTVAKVYFESLPGFYVTGKPLPAEVGASGRVPGIALRRMGTGANGRFYLDNGEAIDQGAGRKRRGAIFRRGRAQSRCRRAAVGNWRAWAASPFSTT